MEARQSSQQRSDSRAIGWGNYDERKNDEAMRLHLDLLDEVRATVKQRLARYQDLMTKHYNSQLRHKDFKVGDLILRKVMGIA